MSDDNRKQNNILSASLVVFFLTFLSKILGFVRSILQASIYGVSAQTDAYNIAYGFESNILYMFAVSISVTLIPFYFKNKNESIEKAKQFATKAITGLFILGCLFSAFLVAGSSSIVKIIAPSYDGDILQQTISYLQVLCLGFVFALVANLYTHVLNAERKYFISTVTLLINSSVIIIFMLIFNSAFGIWALVLSVPVAHVFQCVFLYIIGNQYAKISFRYGLKDESFKSMMVQAIPVLLSQATIEINQMVDKALLTGLEVGTLTAVSYAAVLYNFVGTLVSAPIYSVVFTELSDAGSINDYNKVADLCKIACKLIAFICVPIIVTICFCATEIVSIVFGHGEYTEMAINQSAIALKMYSMCLLPGTLKALLNRAFYAKNDTKRPMAIGFIEVALNIALSIMLVRDYGIVGVVGATAIATLIATIMRIFVFERKHICLFNKKDFSSFFKISLSTYLAGTLGRVLSAYTMGNIYINLIAKMMLICAVFFCCLWILHEETFIMTTMQLVQKISSRVHH